MINKNLRVIFVFLLALATFKIFSIFSSISTLNQLRELDPDIYTIHLIKFIVGIIFILLGVAAFICGLLAVLKPQIKKVLLIVAIVLLGIGIAYYTYTLVVSTISLTNVNENIFKQLSLNYLKNIAIYVCKIAALVVGVNLYKKEGRIIYEEECA